MGSAREILDTDLPGLPGRRRRLAIKGVLLVFRGLIAIEGAERLAALPDPTLFVLNHGNAAEALLVPSILLYLRGRPLHVLADWIYLHLPVLGGLLRLGEPIPVYGKRARWGLFERRRREAFRREPVLDACLARLAGGASVALFPEGTRNPDLRRLLPARRGLGELVLASSAPVVPIGIRYPAAGRLGRVPRLGRLVLSVGEPLDLSRQRARAAELAAARPSRRGERRELARATAAEVMAHLAALCGKWPALDPRTHSSTDRRTRCATAG